MTQIDGLLCGKTTVCSSKSVNFRDQNRRFTPFISQKSKSAIGILPFRHRNNQVAKGLKVTIPPCQDFRLQFNTSWSPFTFFTIHKGRPTVTSILHHLLPIDDDDALAVG